MSRKLLSLAYIYENRGEYEKAILCFDKVLRDQKRGGDFTEEARVGLSANILAMKYRDERLCRNNLDMQKMSKKIEEFVSDDRQSVLRWLSKWN